MGEYHPAMFGAVQGGNIARSLEFAVHQTADTEISAKGTLDIQEAFGFARSAKGKA